MTYPSPLPSQDPAADPRTLANRANAQLSTGPRTEEGKQRSAQNAVKHGLCAASPVLPTEDRAVYNAHRQQFFDEYKPATPTESQLVQELVDTSWRLNRIPLLEADALARAAVAAPDAFTMGEEFDVVCQAHRMLATLGLHSSRLSHQFNRTLAQLRQLQAARAERERQDLADAAVLLQFHKHKSLPWQPSDHGFVFSKEQIDRFAGRLQLLNQAKNVEYAFSDQPPSKRRSAATNHRP